MKKLLLIILTSISLIAVSNTQSKIADLFIKSDNAYNTNTDSVIIYLKTALNLSRELQNDTLEVETLIRLITFCEYKGDFDNGLIYYTTAINHTSDLKTIARINISFAPLYEKIGDYDAEIDLFIKSINILNKFEISEERFVVFGQLSRVFLLKGNYNKSLEYSKLSLSVAKKLNDKKLIAGANFILGNIYLEAQSNGETEESKVSILKAIESYNKSLEYFIELKDNKNLAQTYNNIGLAYQALKDYRLAEKNFILASKIVKQINYLVLDIYIESELGDLYRLTKDYNKSEKYLLSALAREKEVNYVILTKNLYNHGYMLYKETGNHDKSLEFFEKYNHLVDSLAINDNNEKILEVETKFRTNEKQKEIELLNTKTDLQKAELKKRNIINLLFLIGILFISGFSYVIYQSRKKQIKTNLILDEKNIKIGHQQKEIIDSINYAKRIQDATLGSITRIKSYYNNAAIMFKPKDIVSGDFYWVAKNENNFMFSVADCTGHGVPGAMMSMIGNNALNDAVKNKSLTKPSDILTHLSDSVRTNFTNTESDIKDGMDIAFCSLDLNTNVLQYAGALNPLYVCKSNGIIIEIKGDKSYIGQVGSTYTNHTIQLENGDSLYIMSDGYCDQFGGEKNKKFKASNFKTFITSINHLPAEEQKQLLEANLNVWKGNMEQTDDICVLVVTI